MILLNLIIHCSQYLMIYQYYFIKSHIDALTIMKRNEMKKDKIF